MSISYFQEVVVGFKEPIVVPTNYSDFNESQLLVNTVENFENPNLYV